MLGAAASGFINGLAGTGTALFALGFYLVVLPPITAVAIVAFMSVLAGLQGLWVVRTAIIAQPFRLSRFIVPGLAGVPLGFLLLQMIDAQTLRIGIAVMLIIYGGYFSFRAALPAFERPTPWLDGTVGFVGGVLGGAASLSGALPAMWLSLRPWPKAETRAVLQPYNVIILLCTITLLYFRGAYDATALRSFLVVIPVGLITSQIGIHVYKIISDDMFRRLLIGMTLVLGIGILIQATL